MKIISLNGVDDVGKSQQKRLLDYYLNHLIHFSSPLVKYMKGGERPAHELSDWWFETSTKMEFLSWICHALQLRFEDTKKLPLDTVVLHERGTSMFIAVSMATLALKDGTEELKELYTEVCDVFSQYDFYSHEEDDLFLLKDLVYSKNVSDLIKLSKPPSPEDESASELSTKHRSDRYARYQSLLQKSIMYVIGKRHCDTLRVDDSIIPINEKVRLWIKEKSDIQFDHRLILNDNLKIFGFSGLTESGKSSHAQALMSQSGGYRLKLSFFDAVTSRYTYPKVRDEHVALSLLDFTRSHYFAETFTVESLHGMQLSAVFKIFFGDCFKIVYMECSEETRVSRAMHEHDLQEVDAIELIRSKDGKKGVATTIMNRQYADIIIDSSLGDSVQEAIQKIL